MVNRRVMTGPIHYAPLRGEYYCALSYWSGRLLTRLITDAYLVDET